MLPLSEVWPQLFTGDQLRVFVETQVRPPSSAFVAGADLVRSLTR
jgi:hypothetical protein